jgi:hypothetical protein
MYYDHVFLIQAADDRRQALRQAAAAHRLAGVEPARRRFAQSLRRAADRVDALSRPSTAAGCPACR